MEEKENQCTVIAEYENAHGIPEAERCTEYVEEFGTYMFRLEISPGKINERYAAARAASEGRVLADGKKLTAVFRKTITGNIQDTAKYGLHQEEEMLRDFYMTEAAERKLGLCIGEEVYFLLRQGGERNVPPEMLSLPFGLCEARYMERLDEVRSRWLKKLIAMDYREHDRKLKEAVEAVGGSRERKQPEFNFTKEIRKRMRVREKIFMEERMEGYDFREVDLQDAIFINCQLSGSNFSHCNLEHAFFFHCRLKACEWYGAALNGCVAYYGGELVRLQDFIREKSGLE